MSNIINIMSKDSTFWWLFITVSILVISYITIKLLYFKTFKKTKPENLPKQFKINKIFVISILTLFTIHFLYYPIYYLYLTNNIKDNITYTKSDKQIIFTSNNPLLKSETFAIETEKKDYFVLNHNDEKFIKLKKSQLEQIQEIPSEEDEPIITPMDIIHYLENRNQ